MITGTGSHPLVGAGLDTSEGRSFVRERLALLGKTLGLLAFAFYAVLFTMFMAMGAMPPLAYVADRGNLMHLGGATTLGLLWLFARRHDASLRTLGVVDALSLVVACAFWSMMTDEHQGSGMVALLAGILTVVARAVIVPSSARRTLVLTSVALAPTVVTTVMLADYPAPRALYMLMYGINATLWLGAATAVSAVASSVIYGLRQRVKEASDLGAYTLEEKIGSGGMGEVWRARHRMLIRPAAVKLVRPSAFGSRPGDPEVLLRRFEREARATAALRCPHTVELYDFGVAEDGTLYYVMELLEGFNLEQLVTRFGPQPAERVVHLLRQVCCSLGEAHRNGLIHRDIKPANIFVTRLAMAADFVKVVDFGLVKLDRARPTQGDPGLTASGSTTGTPAFMAPETALGDGKSDHRADLYSFGCVAYWLLTGKLVFEGGSMAVLVDHARTPPPRPSTRTELPIPPELEQLVLDCLEKDPARRPPTAADIVTRLEAVPLRAPWTQERAEKWWHTYARDVGERRLIADFLISQETQPHRVVARSEARS